jgi:hypothetical protein
MRLKKWGAKIAPLLPLFAALFVPQIGRATDIPIFPTGPVFRLNGLVWGTSTQPGFNNNYFFVPFNQNESICIYVYNNNTTSAHSFNGTIVVTGNPQNITPSDGTWTPVMGITGFSVPAAPGNPSIFSSSINGASQVSINLSASSTQAGSPETANVVISQVTGSCNSSSGVITPNPQLNLALQPIQAHSENFGQSYLAAQTITNPALGQLIIGVVPAVSNTRTTFFSRVLISTSASGEVDINTVTTTGTGCTTTGASDNALRFGQPNPATLGIGTCTTNPAPITSFKIFLAANSQFVFDASGIISNINGSGGLTVTTPAAITGSVHASIFYYEK